MNRLNVKKFNGCIAFFGFLIFTSSSSKAQNACIDLFKDMGLMGQHIAESGASLVARSGLFRGAFFHLSSGEIVKVIETPGSSDKHVKVLRFRTTQEIELIKIEDLTTNSTGPVRLYNFEGEVKIEDQVVVPMRTLLYSKDLNQSFFFTGKGYANIYSPVIEVYSHKLKTMILISADQLLIATPERKSFISKLNSFRFVDYHNLYSRAGSNLDGIHRFEIDIQSGALMASVTRPDAAPGVDLPRMWKKSIESFGQPVQIPQSIGDGFVVCVQVKNFYGVYTYKFAFFKTPEEARDFAAQWKNEGRNLSQPI